MSAIPPASHLTPHTDSSDYRGRAQRVVDKDRLQNVQAGIWDCSRVLPKPPAQNDYKGRAAYVMQKMPVRKLPAEDFQHPMFIEYFHRSDSVINNSVYWFHLCLMIF